MGAALFRPKGEAPEWRLIYEAMIGRPPGTVVTYEELGDILGRDFLADRAPWYQARGHVLRDASRAFVNIPGVGYRIVVADDHTVVAGKHEKRARRQVRSAVSTLTHVRLEEMTPSRRKQRDEHLIGLARVEQTMRQLGKKVNAVEVRQDVADETVERIAERLQALEQRMGIQEGE